MKREEIETVYQLTLEGLNASQIGELFRLAKQRARLAVEHCNRQLTEREEKRIETLKARIGAIVPTAHTDGDHRGYVVKVMLKNGAYNTWGGRESGWGIA